MCTSWLYRTTRQVDVTSRHDCEPTSPKALEVQRLRVSGHALSQPVSQPCPIQLIPTCQNPAISCNSLLGVFTVRLKWCMHVCVCVRVCSEVVWRALLIPVWCGKMCQLFCCSIGGPMLYGPLSMAPVPLGAPLPPHRRPRSPQLCSEFPWVGYHITGSQTESEVASPRCQCTKSCRVRGHLGDHFGARGVGLISKLGNGMRTVGRPSICWPTDLFRVVGLKNRFYEHGAPPAATESQYSVSLLTARRSHNILSVPRAMASASAGMRSSSLPEARA